MRVGQGDQTTLRNSIGYSPHQVTTNATYRSDGLSWQWQLQYLGKTKNDPDAADNAFDFPNVGDVLFVNTSIGYEVNDRLELRFIVDNVFDQDTPFPVPANGGTVTYFDGILGRYFKASASVRF